MLAALLDRLNCQCPCNTGQAKTHPQGQEATNTKPSQVAPEASDAVIPIKAGKDGNKPRHSICSVHSSSASSVMSGGSGSGSSDGGDAALAEEPMSPVKVSDSPQSKSPNPPSTDAWATPDPARHAPAVEPSTPTMVLPTTPQAAGKSPCTPELAPPTEGLDSTSLIPAALKDVDVDPFFIRKDAVRGLRLIPEGTEQTDSEDSSDGSDYDADGFGDTEDWLEAVEESPEQPSPSRRAQADHLGVSSRDLFERRFEPEKGEWAHLTGLKAVLETAEIDAEQQLLFKAALDPQEFTCGQYIVQEGDAGDAFYLVTEGEVVVTRWANDEKTAEDVVTHLYEGHFFGETSLVKEEPRNANVKVSSVRASVMVMSKDKFEPFLAKHNGFRRFIDELVAKKDATIMRRLEVMLQQDEEVLNEEEKRNEVKLSLVRRRAKTKSFKTIINNYVFLEKLGQGAYGTVFLVTAVTDGKYFAMKHVDRASLRKKRFSCAMDSETLREITVMKRLQHRNVVALHEVIDDPTKDCFYMVTEYMELGSIMTEEEVQEPLPQDKARKHFRDIVQGLDYLHFQNVIHRDIKPGNILIGVDGVCKIGDFGTAVLTSSGVIKGNDVRGTPAFMAPELFAEDLESYHGRPVDIWALGVTLYTMIVGRPPFMAENEIKLVEVIQEGTFRFPVDMALDPHLRNLIKKMLTLDPKERFSLEQVMTHDWVTVEGSEPLIMIQHQRIKLIETSVLSDNTFGVDATMVLEDGDSDEEESKRQLSNGRFIERLDVSEVGSNALDLPPALSTHRSNLEPTHSVQLSNRSQSQRRSSVCASDLSRLKVSSRPELLSGVLPPRVPWFFMSASPDNERRSLRKSTTSFHNMNASQISLVSKGGGVHGTQTKEHLRALRERQFRLLSEHTTLSAHQRDVLLEQQRLPIHSSRATAHIEEFFMDKHGAITDSAEQTPSRSRRSFEQASLPSVPSAHSVTDFGGPSSADATLTPLNGVSYSFVDSPNIVDSPLDSSPGTASLGSDTLSKLSKEFCRTGTEDSLLEGSGEPPRRHYSLRRLNDFVMVTSGVNSAGAGMLQQKLVFQSKAKDGSLSITGGRQATPMRSRNAASRMSMGPLATDRTDDPRRVIFEEENMLSGEITSFNEDEEVEDEFSSDDDDDDYALDDLEVLDDMEGKTLAGELGTVLDSLTDHVDKKLDEELKELGEEELAAWKELRESKLFGPMFGNPLGLLVGTGEMQGRRNTMEDKITALPDLNAYMGLPLHHADQAFFGVYDGHGGVESSTHLQSNLHKHLCWSPAFEEDIVTALMQGSLSCDQELLKSLAEADGKSGSTAVVLFIRKGTDGKPTMLYCANVGDSRAIISRDGVAVPLSVDHKPSRPDEKNRIALAGGNVVNNRLYGTLGVSRAFGDLTYKTLRSSTSLEKSLPSPTAAAEDGVLIAVPEVIHEKLLETDEFAVLACDGVWDLLTPQEVVNFVRRRLLVHQDPERAAEELCQKAIDLCTIDNVSVIIVRFPNCAM